MLLFCFGRNAVRRFTPRLPHTLAHAQSCKTGFSAMLVGMQW